MAGAEVIFKISTRLPVKAEQGRGESGTADHWATSKPCELGPRERVCLARHPATWFSTRPLVAEQPDLDAEQLRSTEMKRKLKESECSKADPSTFVGRIEADVFPPHLSKCQDGCVLGRALPYVTAGSCQRVRVSRFVFAGSGVKGGVASRWLDEGMIRQSVGLLLDSLG